MAAKTIKIEQFKLILRLWRAGHSKKSIVRQTGLPKIEYFGKSKTLISEQTEPLIPEQIEPPLVGK